MKAYHKDSITINRVENGYLVLIKGTIEEQEDMKDGVYVFASFMSLVEWLKDFTSAKDLP